MEAITKHLDENENVHVMRSLNRNVFRLLGAMSTMAGVPSPALGTGRRQQVSDCEVLLVQAS
jgi:hypothetical protein